MAAKTLLAGPKGTFIARDLPDGTLEIDRDFSGWPLGALASVPDSLYNDGPTSIQGSVSTTQTLFALHLRVPFDVMMRKKSTRFRLGNWMPGTAARSRRDYRSATVGGLGHERLEPRIVLDSTVVFNEVFYNPVGADAGLEWVELHNQMAVDMDLAGWRIDGGIEYEFAEGSILPGREYVVVAKDPAALALATGFSDALGPFTGSLSNGGEELVLYDSFRSFHTRSLPDPPPSVDPDKLWSVDIQGVGGIIANPTPPTKTGVEPILGLGNVWNNFDVAGHTGTTLNPSAELVDSSGNDSPVTFSVTGRVSGWANNPGDPLIDDYLFVNAGNSDDDITWEIGGLASGELYEFYTYGGVARDATITVDIGGDGSLSDDTGRIVAGSGFRFDTITASDAGRIIGSMAPGTVPEGNWGGFQLFQENEIPAAAASLKGLPGDGGLEGRRVMDSVNYGDDAPWPMAPDGSGATLAKRNENSGSSEPGNWTTSAQVGGTPGQENFVEPGPIIITEVADSSGNGNHGTPTSLSFSTANEGFEGKAGVFNGSSSHVDVPININPTTRPQVTIGAWVNAAGIGSPARHEIISSDNGGFDRALTIDSRVGTSNTATPHYAAFGGGATGVVAGSDAATTDGWTFVAVVYDNSAGSTVLYVDSQSFVGSATHNPSQTFTRIGAHPFGIERFDGLIDNVFIFDDALSAAQIEMIRTGGADAIKASNAELLGMYEFEDEVEDQRPIALPELAINEVTSADAAIFQIELFNYGGSPIDVRNFVLSSSDAAATEYVLPGGLIPAGGYMVLDAATIGFVPDDGDLILLYADGKTSVIDAVRVAGQPQARHGEGTGLWLVPDVATFAAANSFALQDDIVINEIFYHAYPRRLAESIPELPFQERDEEWIEIFNRGSESVNLTGWSLDGGIDFEFPSGTSIAPNEHLAIAGDVSMLSSKYPAISGQIIGEFDGRLSNSGELIMLVDDIGNPADEVRYYDDGRWPKSADGRGSSLELRDPLADNSVGESWSGSDESTSTDWQTYRYRGTAADDGIGNSIFHEFVLGLLDAGEVLLDDLSVIEDPDGASIELLQNGDFEADSIGQIPASWRLIGTHGDHGQSIVTLDPVNPGNHVLRLVATGPTEDKHNQASTTYANSQQLDVGSEYEISFRAKWISGSNQVNTRLYFNYLQQTTLIDTPTQWGTPGEPNSVLVANLGPTYQGVTHTPVVPATSQAVTVSVRADDRDGIAAMSLNYSVNGTLFSTVPMVLTDGVYSGTIPAQSSGAEVQFYVQGTDSLGAASTFPAAGAASRAMYEVDDGRAQLGRLHNVRIVMTPADRNFLYTNINRMSNHRLGATVIYDESEIYYDVGIRLKGSAFGRNNDSVAGLSMKFQPNQLFRGVHETVSIERAGNPKEIVAKHMLNRAAGGLTSFYDDVAYVITPRTQDAGVALLAMARTSGTYLDSLHRNAGDIPVYNLELLYSPRGTINGNPESPKLNFPYTHDSGRPQFEDLGDDKETYRWNFQLRSSRDRDDYQPLIAAAQTFSLTGQELEEMVAEVIDVDQWMRTFAMLSLNGNDDVYTRLWEHNFRAYARPEDGKLVAVPWDLDRAFQLSTGASPWGILNNAGVRNNVANIIERPVYTRLFWGHVLDIINTTANSDYMEYWTGHYGSLIGRSFAGELAYISRRANSLLGQMPGEIPFEITTNNGDTVVVNDTVTVLEGRGWVNVREIRATSPTSWHPFHTHPATLEIKWLDDENWQITLPTTDGSYDIELQAIDHQGSLVGMDTVHIDSSIENFVRTALVVSEIHYNPADPTPAELATDPTLVSNDFEFLEFTNVRDQPINLTNVRITDGVDFVFPAVDLTPGEHVVVVQDIDAFRLRYGDDATIVGEITSGRLSNGGERITVARATGEEIIGIDYTDNAPWPEAPDGLGATLELVNGSLTTNHANGVVDRWRGSTNIGGTPGRINSQPVGVVINEILTNTDLPTQSDAIELFNATDAPIDIGGWFLSDSGNNLLKFQIPADTVLAAGDYLVFDESDFNPTPASPAQNHFSLNGSRGDDVWLVSADTNGRVTTFVDEVHFRAAANGITFGRIPNGDGPLASLARNTLGCTNSHLELAPVVISEFSYNPGGPSPGQIVIDPTITADDIEYIELHNVTSAAVDLTGWRLRGGVDMDFDEATQIGPNEVVVLISFDPLDPANATKLAAFEFRFAQPLNFRVIGGYTGQLSDSGESFRLQRPDTPPIDDPTFTPYVTVDEIAYDENTPWPTAVGTSLARLSPVAHGSNANSWITREHAGQAIYEDTDFTGDGIFAADDLDRMFDVLQQGADHLFFDFSQDGAVTDADVDDLLASIGSLPGDANLDGVVNAVDLNRVGINWRQSHCMTWQAGDFTGDGAVTAADLNVVGIHWRETAAAPLIAAPAQRLPRAPLPAMIGNPNALKQNATQWLRQDSAVHSSTETEMGLRRESLPPITARHELTLSRRTISTHSGALTAFSPAHVALDAAFADDLWARSLLCRLGQAQTAK